MPRLIALIALSAPRLAIILVVIFSDYIGAAFNSNLWLLLGFFFMPVTTLAYAFAINSAGSVTGFYLIVVIVAVLIDLGMIGGSSRTSRRHARVTD